MIVQFRPIGGFSPQWGPSAAQPARRPTSLVETRARAQQAIEGIDRLMRRTGVETRARVCLCGADVARAGSLCGSCATEYRSTTRYKLGDDGRPVAVEVRPARIVGIR
jgi:hypothetical protein